MSAPFLAGEKADSRTNEMRCDPLAPLWVLDFLSRLEPRPAHVIARKTFASRPGSAFFGLSDERSKMYASLIRASQCWKRVVITESELRLSHHLGLKRIDGKMYQKAVQLGTSTKT
jgi:hypothetical protein